MSRNKKKQTAAPAVTPPPANSVEAHQATLENLAAEQGFKEPAATVTDPGSQVQITPFEADMGPKAAINKRPLAPIVTTADGISITRIIVKDMLDVALEKNLINNRMHGAGKEFKSAFDATTRGLYPAVNLNGGGGGPNEGAMDLRLFHSDRLRKMFEVLGGEKTYMATVMRCIVGEGRSFNDMTREYPLSWHEWRGLFRGALETLAAAIYDGKGKKGN